MTLTLILIAIGALLFLIIIYNILQQYRQKQEAEKRTLLLKHKNIINETDELLLHASQLPFSKALVMVLYNRILYSLQTMQQQDPTSAQIKSRRINIEQQLQQVKEHYQMEQTTLKAPESDQQAIHMLQIVKRLRALLRIEHNKGKLGNQTFVVEDRHLELMQLKINLVNLAKRAQMALNNKDSNMARQMLTKGLSVLEQVPDKDDQLKSLEENLQQRLSELTQTQSQAIQEQKARAEEQEKSELDLLFEPKKKW
ncbi:DNA repair ATPase [Oceanisphaera psychrotolerans]|uniref:DNA repair ATPase n=1 Tax=Oceanisphaera psychrotolerans TaxID=1414654 RepID=A0A1J4QGN1_9GAMM|nr:DNA repair ATPase [Oceanisphaera psychrotolerans]OIN13978.1 DNA repair ATPase [Oceanisphaera psychrotolerans]